jgi:hypothetical protein
VLRTSRLVLALAALFFSLEGAAGKGAGTFSVHIALAYPGNPASPATGICTSQTLSDQTGAIVQVVCSTGQFVSISPRPGVPFAGVHGGAFTYYFSPSSGYRLAGLGSLIPGSGTITGYRVYTLDEYEGRIDFLVSF